jgi:hypothetical protein
MPPGMTVSNSKLLREEGLYIPTINLLDEPKFHASRSLSMIFFLSIGLFEGLPWKNSRAEVTREGGALAITIGLTDAHITLFYDQESNSEICLSLQSEQSTI